MRSPRTLLIALPAVGMLAACPAPPNTDGTDADTDSDTDSDTQGPLPDSIMRTVRVTLDGEPVQDAVVVQGGVDVLHRTGADGSYDLEVDLTVRGEWWVVASHPQARVRAKQVRVDGPATLELDLVSYERTDNPEYIFQDPGTPSRRDTTNQCAHCHNTLNDDWWSSVHRTAASNPELHDLYSGTASAISGRSACEDAGGSWSVGLEPGTGGALARCYLGPGVLPDLDPSCAPNCDGKTAVTGGCADCHAPGIDGELGGRDLLAATGLSFEAGVHCDVCHKVDLVDPTDPDPGVAGKLVVQRPNELDDFPIAGPYEPIQFGPHHDSPNPRMGSVQRDHYKTGQICAGCHEHAQAALVPGTSVDTSRWADGRFPVHSTWTEWQRGPFGGEVPCNSCHMPPAPDQLNGANLQDLLDTQEPGLAPGWIRPAGAVRHHSWVGPRTDDSRMLQLAAAIDLQTSRDGEALTVQATVQNVGAGHRLPTGEPGRQIVLHVQADCDGAALPVLGGDAIPPWVGALARKTSGEDWTVWPQAQVGDTVRVLAQEGWRDDPGFGPFGDGTFSGAQAGNARWTVRGVRTITALIDGVATFEDALPEGDLALLGPPLAPPSADARADAGAPGHAFARVLADANGNTAVPHHRAVDVVSDNRLAPYEQVTTTHVFRATCELPTARAWLTWRAHPYELATQKRWSNPGKIMAEVSR